MKTLEVALGSRSYPIHIGASLLGRAELILPQLAAPRVVIISNETVAPLYLECLAAPLVDAGVALERVVLPDGERYKDWQTLNLIHDALLGSHCERSTTLIALGGGVIGDLAGFAAATYQRGVPFIQAPTTLLAQVDSSVGGKTGINHPRGKNMVGAFWQPRAVIADMSTLASLPERELKAGLAEVIKTALIRDLPFFEWLEANLTRLLARETEALAEAVERCCRNKAEVVAADEREESREGGRALLNLGHTFGHAIETGLGYGVWLHGEAVAAGTAIAAELSHRLGWLDEDDAERVRRLIARAGLPVSGPRLGAERYIELMRHDKKVAAGRLRLVLLRGLGAAVTSAEVPESDIAAAINDCCERDD